MAMTHTRIYAPQRRTHHLPGLAWHGGAFVIMNAYLLLLDMTVGQAGVQWSFRITEAWGLALTLHALVCIGELRQLEGRKAKR